MTGKDMTAAREGLARAKKKCPECDLEVSANNYSRHVATHGNGHAPIGRPPGPRAGSEMSGRAATAAVGAYLDELAEGGRRKSGVYLGKLAGFPTWTDDPDIIDKAADAITDKAIEAESRIVEVKARQRSANLRAVADQLRAGSDEDTEAGFVAVAAQWADDNGITYEVFRDMGVPARVLKDAGVAR